MPTFRDTQQFYACVGELMERAKRDPRIGPKIAKSGIIIQFRYQQPEAITTIDARGKPTQAGAFVDVVNGPCALKPDVVMTMKADVSHAFWHGKVNLVAALARRDIIASGPIPKILKLLPAIEPLYQMYPALLREKGLGSLVLN